MKLNYKRTLLVGLAFFLISAVWQAYDAIIPLILTNHFGLPQSISGAVMSIDNVLAVFLLPILLAITITRGIIWLPKATVIHLNCPKRLTIADSALNSTRKNLH